MESAFPRLVALPPPAPGALGFARAEGTRARFAADREKTFGVKLVDRNIELGAARRDLIAGAIKQRRDLHQSSLGVPGDEISVGALLRLVGAQPGDPGRGPG